MQRLPDNRHPADASKVPVKYNAEPNLAGRSVLVETTDPLTGRAEPGVIQLPPQPSQWWLNTHGDVVALPVHSGQQTDYPRVGAESYYAYIIPKKLRQGFVPWEEVPPMGARLLVPDSAKDWLTTGRQREQAKRREVANLDAVRYSQTWEARKEAEATATAQAMVKALKESGAVSTGRKPRGEE
jgi:hypothetical protein